MEFDIPFHVAHIGEAEYQYVAEALSSGDLSGDGPFSRRCGAWLQEATGGAEALLTPSGTAALEMAALLVDIEAGDEIIMPSFTFPSTANAFVLRGATPVFVDIRPDTLNLDERLIEAALTPRTRAVVPVHYAGVACEMDVITEISRSRGLRVIADAAQSIGSFFHSRPVAGLGDLSALSFHDTKVVGTGEGGALLINDRTLNARAEIIREKGTNRSQYLRGEVDKYTWIDIGSSFLVGELTAAMLLAQLEASGTMIGRRLALWERYHERLAPLEAAERLQRPHVPAHCTHNGHFYYVLLPSAEARHATMDLMRANKIQCASHYVPLHSSTAGRRFGKVAQEMVVTDDVAGRLLRLPLWVGLTEAQQDLVANILAEEPS